MNPMPVQRRVLLIFDPIDNVHLEDVANCSHDCWTWKLIIDLKYPIAFHSVGVARGIINFKRMLN